MFLENILYPFVDEEVQWDTQGWDPSILLDDSHTFVVWCDGDFAQLDVTTDPETVAEFLRKYIDACKQSAG
jgi:hypothetical protein